MRRSAFNFHVFLSLSLLIFSSLTFASDVISPKNTVMHFYHALLNDDSRSYSKLVNKYVSDELLRSINDSSLCNYDSDGSVSAAEIEKLCSQKHECKEDKRSYICDWYGIWVESDVNYFTKSQDIYPSWETNIKTSLLMQTGQESIVNVTLGDGTEPINTLRVALKKVDNSWKIIRVMGSE